MIKSIVEDYNNFMKFIDEKLPDEEINILEASENYKRPTNVNEYKQKYGLHISNILLEDPAIKFMASTGISLIMQEDTLEAQMESWNNWNLMSTDMKEKSDQKARELFGHTNKDRYNDFCKYKFGYSKALEAPTEQNLPEDDGAKSNTQSVDKSEALTAEEKGKAIGSMIMDILDNLCAHFEDMFGNLFTATKLMFETDEGFIKNYTDRKKNYKPSKGQEVTVYDYNSQKINTLHSYFNALMKKSIVELSNMKQDTVFGEESIFEISEDKFLRSVLDFMHIPASIDSMDNFLKLVRDDFRGKKVTIVVRPSDIPKYESVALNHEKALRTFLNGEKKQIDDGVNAVRTTLRMISNNKTLSDDVRNRAKKYMKRLCKLEKIYGSYIDTLYRLKMEEVQSAREVLKRMYSF